MKGFEIQTLGNDVDPTNSLILLVRKMLCSQLHCQKVFKLKFFSYKIPLTVMLRQIKAVSLAATLLYPSW